MSIAHVKDLSQWNKIHAETKLSRKPVSTRRSFQIHWHCDTDVNPASQILYFHFQVIVDFTASWCGPCKMMAPFFYQYSKVYTNVIFLKVDVDEAKVWPFFICLFLDCGFQISQILS